MKYKNGKEFYFLETPPQVKNEKSQNSKFKSSKKQKILQKQKAKRHKEFVEKLSEGLNILNWLQSGNTNTNSKKTIVHPVKISFPMGFQKVDFEGKLKGISLEGEGKYTWLQGCLEYKGEIKSGLRHGRGSLILKDPFLFYKGNFAAGLKEGKGLLLHSSQNIFKGFFSRGLRTGFGMMAYAPEGISKINFKENEKDRIGFKKRKARTFKTFFNPQTRNSLGSNLESKNNSDVNLGELIHILIKAIKDDNIDSENELHGIVLGVKKHEFRNKKWSDGILLKTGKFLNFKDQKIKDNWKDNLFIGNWR